jgi:hypothetical protein
MRSRRLKVPAIGVEAGGLAGGEPARPERNITGTPIFTDELDPGDSRRHVPCVPVPRAGMVLPASKITREKIMTDTLINQVVQRTGLSEDKARAAVETVVGFLKERAPAGLSGQIDSLVGGGEGSTGGDIASKVGGMFGGKKEGEQSR